MNLQCGDRVELTNKFYTGKYHGQKGVIKSVAISPSGILVFCKIKLDKSQYAIEACADHIKVVERSQTLFNCKN